MGDVDSIANRNNKYNHDTKEFLKIQLQNREFFVKYSNGEKFNILCDLQLHHIAKAMNENFPNKKFSPNGLKVHIRRDWPYYANDGQLFREDLRTFKNKFFPYFYCIYKDSGIESVDPDDEQTRTQFYEELANSLRLELKENSINTEVHFNGDLIKWALTEESGFLEYVDSLEDGDGWWGETDFDEEIDIERPYGISKGEYLDIYREFFLQINKDFANTFSPDEKTDKLIQFIKSVKQKTVAYFHRRGNYSITIFHSISFHCLKF
jgi:hypothetical protein